MTARTDALAVRLLPRSAAVDVALVIGFALVTAVAAQIRIVLPFTPVPITGTTFAVLLAGAALGTWRGLAAMLTYVAMGLVGLPVFTGGGAGIEVLGGATGGYILGFVVAAPVVGALAQRGVDRGPVGAVAAFGLGSAIIYAFGVPVLMLVTGWGLAQALMGGVVPFLVGDAVKAGFAGVLLPVAHRLGGR